MADSDAIELLIDATPLAAGLDTSGQRLQELGSHAGRDLTEGGGATAAAAGLPRGREAEQATKDTQKLTASLKEQTQVVGLGGHQLEIFKLQQKGAGEEELKAATAAEQGLRSAQRGQALKQAVFSGGGAATAAGLAGGAIRAGLSQYQGAATPKDSVQEGLGMVGQFAQALPGPLGAIAGTVTSTIGSIVAYFNAEANMMKERVGGALSGIISGSKNAREAMASIRTDTLTAGFEGIQRAIAGIVSSPELQQLMGRGVLQARINETIPQVIERAERTQELMRQVQADPRVQEMQRQTAGERAVQGVRGQAFDQTLGQAGQATMRTQELGQGRGLQEAADAADRYARTLALATQIQQPANAQFTEGQQRARAFGQAADMLRGDLQRLAEVQRINRAAQATVQVAEAVRGTSDDIELTNRRLAQMQDMRAITADVVAEEHQLEMLRRQGASADVIQRRQAQIEQLRGVREQESAQQQGRQVTEQTRNPLETFERERERLDQMLQRGTISNDVHARGMQNALQNVERAAGEAPSGQAALQEGSAAAASAILRAQRQMEREDPMARLQRAFGELRDVARAQEGRQRELVDLVRRGEVFRAVNL